MSPFDRCVQDAEMCHFDKILRFYSSRLWAYSPPCLRFTGLNGAKAAKNRRITSSTESHHFFSVFLVPWAQFGAVLAGNRGKTNTANARLRAGGQWIGSGC